MIDWITPRGESLVPTIARNSKCERGYGHDKTGGLLCPANLDWSKDECVFNSLVRINFDLMRFDCRVKEMLRSGNYSVAGDQWPILLYKDEVYDSENPWRGLFRNRLLVLVMHTHLHTPVFEVDVRLFFPRDSSIFLRLRARWIRSQKLLVQGTHRYMECHL